MSQLPAKFAKNSKPGKSKGFIGWLRITNATNNVALLSEDFMCHGLMIKAVRMTAAQAWVLCKKKTKPIQRDSCAAVQNTAPSLNSPCSLHLLYMWGLTVASVMTVVCDFIVCV